MGTTGQLLRPMATADAVSVLLQTVEQAITAVYAYDYLLWLAPSHLGAFVFSKSSATPVFPLYVLYALYFLQPFESSSDLARVKYGFTFFQSLLQYTHWP
jgi:hypothetical protein